MFLTDFEGEPKRRGTQTEGSQNGGGPKRRGTQKEGGPKQRGTQTEGVPNGGRPKGRGTQTEGDPNLYLSSFNESYFLDILLNNTDLVLCY
jgi:hypothetical protein